MITSRLRMLEEIGILERRAYSEHPPRFEYGRPVKPGELTVTGGTHPIEGEPW